MKKLIDDNADDLTRALLEAGRSHRPAASNQAKLLLSLGVGGGVGLFSSKAFAWLGTSTGKLTVLSVTVISVGAGVLYGALPSSDGPEQVAAWLSPITSVAAPQVAAAPHTFVPAHVADAPSPPGRGPVAGLPTVNEGPARRANAPAASVSPHRTARGRNGSAARRDELRERLASPAEVSHRETEGTLPAVSPPPAGDTLEASEARASGLDSEIRLVDAMRGAAQRKDARALRSLVESYRGSFPDGQLRAEVAELALRALPSPH